MLVTLTLDFKGVQFLQIKAGGSHGRTVSSGTRLLFDKERALLAAAFPGKKKVAAKEVRAVFEAHGVPIRCSGSQLKHTWLAERIVRDAVSHNGKLSLIRT